MEDSRMTNIHIPGGRLRVSSGLGDHKAAVHVAEALLRVDTSASRIVCLRWQGRVLSVF